MLDLLAEIWSSLPVLSSIPGDWTPYPLHDVSSWNRYKFRIVLYIADFSYILQSKDRSIFGAAISMEIYKYLNSWQILSYLSENPTWIFGIPADQLSHVLKRYQILKEVRMSKFGVLSSGLRSQETSPDCYSSTCTTTSNGGPTSV